VLPAAGGQANARAIARHWAALIGEVDGVRLLPPEKLALATAPQPERPDPLGNPFRSRLLGYERYGQPAPLGQMAPFGHSGAGGTVGYADPAHRLAYALTKNRMVNNAKPGEDAGTLVGNALKAALGIS
jgi:CubicO group peptidase (beta-lactamase class C family)